MGLRWPKLRRGTVGAAALLARDHLPINEPVQCRIREQGGIASLDDSPCLAVFLRLQQPAGDRFLDDGLGDLDGEEAPGYLFVEMLSKFSYPDILNPLN